eukprot:m.6880 g.6880  ORF g.6880 m.6880 type:complete len:1213 (-) comp2669_c0_seq1:190-3828(-)
MKPRSVWSDKVHNKEGVGQSIHCLAFNPDGTHLIVGAGPRVLVYQAADGELLAPLKGHTGTVYSVSYSHDGVYFASGGADKTVIIWKSNSWTGKLKYNHNDAIQSVAFNPINNILVSCSVTDFGFWSLEVKSVEKIKSNTKICTSSWTNDGQYVALGLYNGNVSIRDQQGAEKVYIDRQCSAPVWSLQWNPSETDKIDTLCVCDWDQNMSFYMLSGRQIGKSMKLGYDPCSANYYFDGDYVVVGGSNKNACLYTRDGTHLADIGEQDSWVWAVATRPNQNYVAVGCEDGNVFLYQLNFSTVHALFRERYAYRRNMTNVMVKDHISGIEARVPCRELVKKIAIYKNRLAVQLPNSVNVYEMEQLPSGKLKFRMKSKLRQSLTCNLLVVCSSHIILCHDRRLTSYTFDNTKEREWVTESQIRYIKVIGGPDGREGMLVGLKNGTILEVFVDNGLSIELIKHPSSIRCLDISANRSQLAVVDEKAICSVYDIATKELMYQEPDANAVAWNTQNENMLCYSGKGLLNIKASNFAGHSQKFQGFVVGFSGSSIYCLQAHSMTKVEVPQSHSMNQYLKKQLFEDAYETACLGVTETDWRSLAIQALEGLNFDIAKKAFIRVRDMRYLELIHSIQERKKNSTEEPDDVYRAMVYAYQGRFEEAANLFTRADRQREALLMYCNLKQFDRAKRFLDTQNSDDVKMFMKLQTEWSKTANDPSLTIEMLSAAGEDIASVNMMGENGMVQKLIDKARETNKAEVEVLGRIIFWLQKLQQTTLAAEVCEKLGDDRKLVELYVNSKKWEEAFALANRLNAYKEEIYHPYATWLAENDRFEEAQEAFHLAGLDDKAAILLEVLAYNAVVQNRMEDAGYYYWQIAQSKLKSLQALSQGGEEDVIVEPSEHDLDEYFGYVHRSQLYYAYHSVHRYVNEPFTQHSPENLLSIVNFLLNALPKTVPFGMSKFNILFAASKLGKQLEAFKFARQAHEKMRSMKIPPRFRQHVNIGSVSIRCKPIDDSDDLMPLCYRCSAPNQLWSSSPVCSNCLHPFMFSSYSFEVLPLVEFFPDVDISDGEALELINDDSSVGSKKSGGSRSDADVMTIDDEVDDGDDDPFISALARFDNGCSVYEPMRVDRGMLKSMPSNEVFVQQWEAPLQFRYFRNVLPEIATVLCPSCKSFFGSDDWEHVTLKEGACPRCRAPLNDDGLVEAPQAKLFLGSQGTSSA